MSEHLDRADGTPNGNDRVEVEMAVPAAWAAELRAVFEESLESGSPGEIFEVEDDDDSAKFDPFTMTAAILVIKWAAGTSAAYAFGKVLDEVVKRVRDGMSNGAGATSAKVLMPDDTVIVLDPSDPERFEETVAQIRKALL